MAKRSTYPIKRKKRIIITLSSISLLAVVGSVSGTYAWFEYAARAGLDFKGTTVGEVDGLDIGFFSNANLEDYKKYNLTKDDKIPNLYWSNTGLDSDTMMHYAEMNGYGGKNFSPVTSGEYHPGDDFILSSAPAHLDNSNIGHKARNVDYFFLDLVFKPSKGSSQTPNDKGIILNDVDITSKGNVKDALRIHFKSEIADFIYNPTVETNGSTPVGGILDLDLDGFYDIDYNNKEFVYGQAHKVIHNTSISNDKDPIDEEIRDTFNGAHKSGTYGVDLINSTFASADYIGNGDVLMDKILTRTSDDNLLHLQMTAYMEGWSRAMNQLEEKNFFSMNLTYELVDL